MDDDGIRTLVSRLARPHPSGGKAVERAALLAAGPDFPQVLAWITEHDGQPEALEPAVVGGGGLHGARIGVRGSGNQIAPLRYVLRAGVLADPGRPVVS
jgi:hypothetical protein